MAQSSASTADSTQNESAARKIVKVLLKGLIYLAIPVVGGYKLVKELVNKFAGEDVITIDPDDVIEDAVDAVFDAFESSPRPEPTT